jgi:hypothetical protein
MKRINHILLLLVLFGFVDFHLAQTFTKPGVTSVQFLKLGISPRSEAMGQAVASSIGDVSATYYNPSGLMNIDDNDFMASYTVMPAGVGLSFLGYAHRLGVDDVIAVSVISLRTDDMKIRTVLQPLGTGQYFHVADYAFGIHYAHNFTYELKIGFTFRYLYLNMVSGLFSKGGWTADMGIQYDTGLKGILEGLKIGMMVANFGPEIKFINESYGQPLKYVVGISKPIKIASNHKILVGINWVKAIDEKQKAQVGLEYDFYGMFFLRGGYKFASDAQSWSGGVGFEKKIIGTFFKIDYSYGDFSLLGNLNSFGIQIKF